MYPIACVVVSEECSAWLKEDGFGHISTGGGAELGCIVALKVLEICGRPEVRSMVHYIADRFGRGLRAIQDLYPDWFIGIRQDGVVMGLEFDHPQGAKLVMRELYQHGVWAIFSTLDPRVLQFKPGILMHPELVDEVLDRTEVSIGRAFERGARRRAPGPPGGRAMSELLRGEPAGVPRARMMLQRAHWAASAFASYDPGCASLASSRRSRRLHTRTPQRYAEWAVRETGMGVVEHKKIKNEVCSRGHRRDVPRAMTTCRRGSTTQRRIVEVPRPAGRRPRTHALDEPRLDASTSRCCCRC